MISVLARDIINQFDSIEKKLEKSINKNLDLIKTLAIIRQKLERSIKTPETMIDAIYDSINLCREQLPNGPKWEIDPPLTRDN